MSLDLGEKTIGIAVSDPLGIIAGGLPTLWRQNIKKDLQYIFDLVKEREIAKVIVGLPLNMDGTCGTAVERTENFALRLRGRLLVPVELWDERLSSKTAEKVLIEGGMRREKRKKTVDKLAAVVILQSYLDAKN